MSENRDLQVSTGRLPRTRGVGSGVLLIVLGAWGGLAAFLGPYYDFGLQPDQAWHWTSARGWLEVLPGAAAVVAGLLLLASASRGVTLAAAWLGMAAGAWFILGPEFARLVHAGNPGGPFPGSLTKITFEMVALFYGVGVLILAVAAAAFGRLSVVSVRDLRAAQERAERDRAAQQQDEQALQDWRGAPGYGAAAGYGAGSGYAGQQGGPPQGGPPQGSPQYGQPGQRYGQPGNQYGPQQGSESGRFGGPERGATRADEQGTGGPGATQVMPAAAGEGGGAGEAPRNYGSEGGSGAATEQASDQTQQFSAQPGQGQYGQGQYQQGQYGQGYQQGQYEQGGYQPGQGTREPQTQEPRGYGPAEEGTTEGGRHESQPPSEEPGTEPPRG